MVRISRGDVSVRIRTGSEGKARCVLRGNLMSQSKKGGAEWKLYLAVLLHVLVRFTAELVPLTTPQGSKRRSDSFFDEGMIVEAGRVRSKRGHWSSRTG